jgi:flagellar motor switch protein FliG
MNLQDVSTAALVPAVRALDTGASLPAGRRRAAVALVALGEERAAAVLSELGETEGAELAATMMGLGPVTAEEITDALEALAISLDRISAASAPGERYTKAVLSRAFGTSAADRIVGDLTRPEPFLWLADADADVAGRVLSAEPPATIALALAHLGPKTGAKLLTRLPEPLRSDVAVRVATLSSVDDETVRTVDFALRERVGVTLRAPVKHIPGADVLAGMLSAASKKAEQSVIARLGEANPKLAAQVRAAMFTFDDLVSLPNRDLQRILSQVEVGDLAVALFSSAEDIRATVENNLSERARANLQEEASYLNGVRPADVRAAQARILDEVRRLEAEGTIVLPRLGDDDAEDESE